MPDGKVRFPGEDAMSRPTLRNFLEPMKAFRYNEKEGEVVILDYGVSKAEKARVWDTEQKAMVTKSIKNHFRQISTLRQYIVVPESRWQQMMDKVWAQPEKNSHRGRDSLFNNLIQNLVGIPRSAVSKFMKNNEFKQISNYPFPHIVLFI
ncbi:MAG: hypothetical protein WB421_17360 [Terriglobales bacterium]